MKTTGFYYHPVFREHETGPGHPERPERLDAVLAALPRSGLDAVLDRREPAPAEVETIERVHDGDYVRHIEDRSRGQGCFHEDADTIGSRRTFEAACLACGAAVQAAEAVLSGELRNAFCAVRPPGHHAGRAVARGFCFFNNVAVAARHLQARHGVEKIAVIDWDVHHGNGTQEIFLEDPSVLYCSLHQYPHYPGTGARSETGVGDGRGSTLNVPVAMGSARREYLDAFRHVLAPAVDDFRPGFILVSAGFDGHRDDPLSAVCLGEEDFGEMTRAAVALAESHCGGRLVSVLEGGYDLASLSAGVVAHLRALSTQPERAE